MGRKKDSCWDHVDKLNDKEFRCTFCKRKFAGGASRIKGHLSGIKGKGIDACTSVPKDVQEAASSTFDDSNKRLCNRVNSSNIEQNFVNSNLPSNLSKGNVEHLQRAAFSTIENSNQNIMRNVNSGYLEVNCFNSNQNITRNVNSGDPQENCLNSNQSIMKDIYLGGPEENFLNSNQSVIRNVNSVDSSKGKAELYPMPTSTDFIGEQFQTYIDTIWGWLMKDEESVIGVCGMGGVGKTTLLKHIYNMLLEASHHVIWVDVPQDWSVFQLQKAIAESCDLHLLDTDGMMKIAAKLLHAFKKIKKCVIILDDVWDDIHLESVGIPLTNSEVQVIIASRLSDVFRTMDWKKNILEVEPLWKLDDSRDLFFKVIGKDESMLHVEVKDIAKSIREKCDCLPLAIVTMARSMRGKEDIREWKHVLKNLRNSEKGQDDMKKCVFPVLRLSYIHLNDKIIQECFLLCALNIIPKKGIRREHLIIHFVDEGLINRKDSLEAHFDEGHIILNKLINNNLLFEDYKGSIDVLPIYERFIDVHRLFWAMAISIANESEGYMVKISEDLLEVPPEQEWKESLQKVRLTIEEIPSSTSPRCPKLSSLNLSGSIFLKLIPNSFFINMPSLKVLNLSYCQGLVHLPTSVSKLESLTALVLRGCSSLKYVPSLAKLQKLRRLDLFHTAITELPLGLETLINLRWLNLGITEELIMSPASVIPKLTNLQFLLLATHIRSMDVKVADLEGLKVLETILVCFSDGNEFNAYVRGIVNAQNRGLTSYFLHLLGKTRGYSFNFDQEVYCTEKTIVFEGIGKTASLLLPIDMNKLQIKECEEWRSLCDVLSFDDKNNSKSCNISECEIRSCHKLENVFCLSSSCSFCSSVQSLERLSLHCLKSLSILCEETNVAGAAPWGPFSSLRFLYVYDCNRMKTLLTPGMTKHLQNLEILRVDYCNAMEEIFSSERNSDITDVDIDALHIDPIAMLCDSCKSATATIFCRVDSAFLCVGCDSKIHAANKLASPHARVWVCEACQQAPAHVTCKADPASLCVTCDRDIHSANPLARRHERVPVTPFYDPLPSSLNSSLPVKSAPINFLDDRYFSDADAVHIDPIKLPKLKSVLLNKLPQLNRVYEGILAFDSLQEFKSDKCPNLKEVPKIQPPFQISVVDDASSDEELSN